MSIEALPCIVCGVVLKNVSQDVDNQPDRGLAFMTEGHYGSQVFDPMNGELLEITVCDECIAQAGEQGRVHTGRRARPVYMDVYGLIGWIRAPYVPVLWRKGLANFDDPIHVETVDEFYELGHGARLLEGLEDLLPKNASWEEDGK